MKQECTQLFLSYREIARLVWNLGFLPNPALHEYDSLGVFEEAMARLFEGMVLHSLNEGTQVQDKWQPGDVAEFRVEATHPDVELWVDKNLPDEPGRLWGNPVIRLKPCDHQLRFLSFFDWDQFGSRDYRLLKVVIQRLDGRPDLVGRHALIELAGSSISVVRDDDASTPKRQPGESWDNTGNPGHRDDVSL
jgi:hypothetical protein